MVIFVLLFCVARVSWADALDGSARRDPAASFRTEYDRARAVVVPRGPRVEPFDLHPSAANRATPYAGAASVTGAPAWLDHATLRAGFERMRDGQFLIADDPATKRRPPWLYPDDGCFTRAALGVLSLAASLPAATAPAKVFVFGNLSVVTPNSAPGRAYWWYHVAPAGAWVGEVNYVLDPSIEPRDPLTLDQWIAAQTDVPASVQVAVCGGGTYRPTDRCDLDQLPRTAAPLVDAVKLLRLEWARLIELNRDPRAELGDRPPWR